ncbi:MAG: 3-oxoacyl-[acyl-carrier-protein] reductase [Negativicutes bacterium]|jgi:3-oxoacyl-[acyl-carrier protein] reductase|nr:3-oxoacyl-[acyl-carrier-protein] reductase [Negativicutes bacterium]
MLLENQIVLVTGGSRGIGKAAALACAREGAHIIINYAGNVKAAEETVKEISDLGQKCLAVQADISKLADVERLIEEATAEFGKIDILVNNAGITRDGLLMRMKEEDWDAVIETNLKGIFLCTKAVIRGMMKQRSGRIINMTSVVGVMGNAGQANYAAAKAGVIGFTKSTAKELASRGITVNAIAPGFIHSDMTSVLPENVKEEMVKAIPIGRMGEAEEVADAVVFLASNSARYITGQVIHVDGGMVM